VNEFAALLDTIVRLATPLALAAVGEVIVERCGIINVGLEGAIIGGCLGAAMASLLGGPWLGIVGGALSGVALMVLFAVFAVTLRGDQIITGTAVTIAAYGLTGVVHRVAFGDTGVGLSMPTLPSLPIPLLSSIPLLGSALFSQSVLTYLVYAASLAAWWFLFRTRAGLALRAVGEHPPSAIASGVRVNTARWKALLIGGACGGLAGGSLVFQAGTFTEQMSAGRGFMAIGIVALGRWHPVGAVLAAFFFGAASALQFRGQGLGLALPYQLFLAAPYALMLLVLALTSRRSFAPEALGRNLTEADATSR
jgi:simple sugar transport system permease protein